MAQSNVPSHLFWNRQNVPKHIDLEFVKILIYCGLKQRFQLVKALLDLLLCFGVIKNYLSIVARCGRSLRRLESKTSRWSRGQTILKARYALIDKIVY